MNLNVGRGVPVWRLRFWGSGVKAGAKREGLKRNRFCRKEENEEACDNQNPDNQRGLQKQIETRGEVDNGGVKEQKRSVERGCTWRRWPTEDALSFPTGLWLWRGDSKTV